MQVKSIAESAILSSFIKLTFTIKTFVLSIFKWPLKTGFTAYAKLFLRRFCILYMYLHNAQTLRIANHIMQYNGYGKEKNQTDLFNILVAMLCVAWDGPKITKELLFSLNYFIVIQQRTINQQHQDNLSF